MAKSYVKRTLRPLYANTQATPKSCFLDSSWDRSVPIWPGMVFTKTAGENVTLMGGTSGATLASSVSYGLGGMYVGGDGIDEPLDAGINTFAVWVLSPDSEFEILAPAFDTGATWADPGDGTEVLLYPIVSLGGNQGKLVPAGTSGRGTLAATPACRLIRVNSATKITVGGIR